MYELGEVVTEQKPPTFYYVYILFEPDTKLVRYIGMTAEPYRRLKAHRERGSPQVMQWGRELAARDLEIQMRIVQVTTSYDTASRFEAASIAKFNRKYGNLLNIQSAERPRGQMFDMFKVLFGT